MKLLGHAAVKVVLFVVLLLASFLWRFDSVGVSASVIGNCDVDVYAVSLSGVNASGVGNLSKVFDGVSLASKVNIIHHYTGEDVPVGMTFEPVFDKIGINVSVTLVTEWTA